MTTDLTERILTVLAQPEWKADPPGSGVIAEVLHESRHAVIDTLETLRIEGRVADVAGSPHVARAGWALTTSGGGR